MWASARRSREAQGLEGGIGIPVIRALSDSVDFSEPDGGGTEVRMRFANPDAASLPQPLASQTFGGARQPAGQAPEMVSITIGPARLARVVLRRVLAALAARAHFSAERVTETQRLSDELVEHLSGSLAGERLSAGISVAPRNLELTVGPLQAGSSLDGLRAVLDRFAAEHHVSHADGSEVLAVHLVEPARAHS